MGKTIVRFEDLQAVNFDKFCRAALEIVHQRKLRLDDITFVVGGIEPLPFPDGHAVSFDDEVSHQDYVKRGFRSMTEMYALRVGLGTSQDGGKTLSASSIKGLAALCHALAGNHGWLDGVKAGNLYRKGTIPTISKSLVLVPHLAPEIALRLIKVIAKALDTERPISTLVAEAGPAWEDVNRAIASAERAVSDQARLIARGLYDGRKEDGDLFPLAKGPEGVEGVLLATRDPNLVKHLWSALKALEPELKIATIVAVHPDSGRIAVTCSTQFAVDVRPVAEALELTFGEPGSEDFSVNGERKSIVWDKRFAKGKQPSGQDVARIVGERLAFPKKEQPAPAPRLGATLADAFAMQTQQKRR